MYSVELAETCPMLNLCATEKFILKKSVDDFKKGKEVEIFMMLKEGAYGFYAVSLMTGLFDFDADGEVVKVSLKYLK